jgi:hypothetical protein
MNSDRQKMVFLSLIFIIASIFIGGCAELKVTSIDEIFQPGRGQKSGLDERTVRAGLKDALRVGTERAVDQTSKTNGFLADTLIHIALPEEFDTVTTALRTLGMGNQVDSLETAMNRAAERASGEAKAVFWEAVTRMTLYDVYGILNGGETAATDYFRAKTSDSLRNRIHPIVIEKMEEVGLYKLYNQIITTYNALPLVSEPAINLEDYVTEKTLDGLFIVLAQEEQQIRRDPAARTTKLLQEVFGR